MKLTDRIYKPFIFARYSLFLKSHKNDKSLFPVKDEYGTLSLFNVVTPIWTFITALLIFSSIIYIPYDVRLVLIGIFIISTYIASKLFIKHLRKNDYVESILAEFDAAETPHSKYNSIWFCLFIIVVYGVAPYLPIVLYFLLKYA